MSIDSVTTIDANDLDDIKFTTTNDLPYMTNLNSYTIDFNKVNTLEDVIKILSQMNFVIYGNGKEYEALKHYLKEV